MTRASARDLGPAEPPNVGLEPASPRATGLPRTSPLPRSVSEAGASVGTWSKAVSAALMGAAGLVSLGANVAHAAEPPASPTVLSPAEAAAAEAYLERMRASMTDEEYARARADLAARRAEGPLPPPAAPTTGVAADAPVSPGAARMDRFVRDLESRMRVTARDLANPGSVTLVPGAPGYKVLSESEVRDLLVDALLDVPIAELPFHGRVEAFVRALPGGESLDFSNTSLREAGQRVGREARTMLEGALGEDYRVATISASVIGFGTVSALRAGDPQVAEALNRVIPNIRLHHGTHLDGHLRLELDARYRGTRILPDLDLRTRLQDDVGPVRFYLEVRGTVALEAPRVLTGEARAGMRIGEDRHFVDVYGTLDDRLRPSLNLHHRLRLGATDPWALDTNLSARWGNGVAIDPSASGRLGMEFDLLKPIHGRWVEGSLGVFVGGGLDMNGRNPELRGGLVFGLRW